MNRQQQKKTPNLNIFAIKSSLSIPEKSLLFESINEAKTSMLDLRETSSLVEPTVKSEEKVKKQKSDLNFFV